MAPRAPPAEPAPCLHPPALGSKSEWLPVLPEAQTLWGGPCSLGGSAGLGPRHAGLALAAGLHLSSPASAGRSWCCLARFCYSVPVSLSLSVCLSLKSHLPRGGRCWKRGGGGEHPPGMSPLSTGPGRPWRDTPSCSLTSNLWPWPGPFLPLSPSTGGGGGTELGLGRASPRLVHASSTAGPLTSAFFNPALAASVTFHCEGHTLLEYAQVYWLGPLTGKGPRGTPGSSGAHGWG